MYQPDTSGSLSRRKQLLECTSARVCQFLGHAGCAHTPPPRNPVPSTYAMTLTACFPHLTTRCWLLLCVPAQARQQCKVLLHPGMIPSLLDDIVAGSPRPIEPMRFRCRPPIRAELSHRPGCAGARRATWFTEPGLQLWDGSMLSAMNLIAGTMRPLGLPLSPRAC